MLHIEKIRPRNSAAGYLFSILALLLCLGMFITFSNSIARRTRSEKLSALEEAIRRASVQCYAIEGRYPPSVEYLEEHYGISIDRSQYHVFYDGWASNLMPDITILPADGEQEAGYVY